MSQDRVAIVAARHGFSPDAARVVRAALLSGRGMAQFDHPELGGRGQWMSGMIMIGSMSDHALKARVAALCADLAALEDEPPPRVKEGRSTMEPMKPMEPMTPMEPIEPWWPEGLGRPDSAGGQGDLSYAYFAGPRRLAVRRDGATTLYDTGDLRIGGVSQGRAGDRRDLAFTGPDGEVPLASLEVVDR